nr:MAG TPA_asm: hypothetical protein [Bacteriophage sp.]
MAHSHFWLCLTFHLFGLLREYGLYIKSSCLLKREFQKSRIDNFNIYVAIYIPQSLRINYVCYLLFDFICG